MAPGLHTTYIQSGEWRALRARYQQHRRWACHICGRKRGLQLHHLTYERLTAEELDDLVPVCPPCHQHIHDHRKAHPELSIREATEAARRAYIETRRYGQHTRSLRRKAKAAARRRNRTPHPGFAERLGLPPGQTKIRYKQQKPTRNAGSAATS